MFIIAHQESKLVETNECQLQSERTCLHCGQELTPKQERFCCPGCQMVWHVLQDKGFGRYYEIKGGQINQPVSVSDEDFAYLTTGSFKEKWVKAQSDGSFRVVFFVKGIQCTACIWLIEKVLSQHQFIRDYQLQMGSGQLSLHYNQQLDLVKLARDLAQMGYRLGLQEGVEASDLKRRRSEVIRLGVSGALAGNLMMFTLPLYTGGDRSDQGAMFAWVNFVLSIPLLFYSAQPFFRKALSSARRGFFHLDIPIALGIAGGEVLSTFNLFTGHLGGVYFDSIGMLVFFLLAGRFIQSRSVERAMEQCQRLMSEMPELTRVKRDGEWEWLVSEDIRPGDSLRLQSGDVLPVDARLVSGASTWNLQVVTGESLPQRVPKDGTVPAGAINMAGSVELVALTDREGGSLNQLEKDAHLEQSFEDENQNSHLAAIFTLATLVIAFTGVWMWWSSGPIQAFKVALTVFVVACPCALALSKPTAEAFGVLKASELGLWIRKGHFFSRMTSIKHIIFDKTGVLTFGDLEIEYRQDFHSDPEWLEGAVCALESHSDHPVAVLLTRILGQDLSTEDINVASVEILPGQGIQGIVQGHALWVGSLEAAQEVFPGLEAGIEARPDSVDLNWVAAICDGKLALIIGLRDKVRPEAHDLLTSLVQNGYKVSVYSGDRQEVVDSLLKDLPGIEGRGRMKPHEKLQDVRSANEIDGVLMVGDGLNDMGALAAASLGVAAGKAAPASLKYADAVLHSPNLMVLRRVIELAKSVKKAIICNIAVSLGYNVTSFYLALVGVIGPLVAAILMPLSSLSVIVISAYIIRRKS